MKKNALNSYIGFAIKSRHILIGLENIVSNKKSFVILFDISLGKNSMEKLNTYMSRTSVKGYCVNVEEYYPSRNCKVLGITDRNLASAIINVMKESDINE